MIMMPSSPMFTTPLRSVYTAPSDVSKIGMSPGWRWQEGRR